VLPHNIDIADYCDVTSPYVYSVGQALSYSVFIDNSVTVTAFDWLLLTAKW